MNATFSSLRVRNYRVYAIGSLVSNIGTWMQNTAQAWLVLELTGSGTALGITVGLQMLPTLLLSPVGGVLADRLPKRTVLKVMQVAMAVPAAALGILAISSVAQAWHVYVLAFVFGIGRALEAPARQSFVAEMVAEGDLGNAVGLNSASMNSARLVGPGIAGLLIAAFGAGVVGTGWVILLNGLSYGAAYVALMRIDATQLRPAPVLAAKRGAIREGTRYVRSRPDLVLTLSCVFFLGGFGMNFQIISALMATEEFGKGAREYGVLGSILAVGSLTGALLAARRSSPRLRVIVLAGLSCAVLQVGAGFMPTYASYAAVLPFVGLSVLTMVTTANAMILLTSAPAMRGRVAALYVMVFIGSVPFTAPVIGWIGAEFGARAAHVSTGGFQGIGIFVVATWYLLRSRTERNRMLSSASSAWQHARSRQGAVIRNPDCPSRVPVLESPDSSVRPSRPSSTT